MFQSTRQFTLVARLLHWIMAAMILAMLFVGVAMVASLGSYHALVSIHRPLGMAVLILAAVRFSYRLKYPPPPFPESMSAIEQLVATTSEYAMYALMFSLPLVGWGMLSAARYPIVLFGYVQLPYILPHNLMLYSILRHAHALLAYAFFLIFIAHFGAILFHTWVVRDAILLRMIPWNARPPKAGSADEVSETNQIP